MSKATNVIFTLGTKSALGLFYMTLPGFSIALKKMNVKNHLHETFFYWPKVSSDLLLNFNRYLLREMLI